MITTEIISDDGRLRVERVLLDGKEIGTNTTDLLAVEAAQELEQHRQVLRQQLDPNQPDPTAKELADAQAFITLDGLQSR